MNEAGTRDWMDFADQLHTWWRHDSSWRYALFNRWKLNSLRGHCEHVGTVVDAGRSRRKVERIRKWTIEERTTSLTPPRSGSAARWRLIERMTGNLLTNNLQSGSSEISAVRRFVRVSDKLIDRSRWWFVERVLTRQASSHRKYFRLRSRGLRHVTLWNVCDVIEVVVIVGEVMLHTPTHPVLHAVPLFTALLQNTSQLELMFVTLFITKCHVHKGMRHPH